MKYPFMETPHASSSPLVGQALKKTKEFPLTKKFGVSKTFALLLMLLLCYSTANAQLSVQKLTTKDQVSIPTPNAASLGLFGEVPVSYFSGTPSIDLPLYSFNEGQVSVPISLSYHASGFRPDVHPGWVGMGWNLSVGGVISRKVNGLADDLNNKENSDRTHVHLTESEAANATNFGYYFNVPLLNPSRWNEAAYIEQMGGIGADIEPDEFSFSFPGGSGKFFLDMDNTWKVSCDREVKVVMNNDFLAVPFSVIPGSILTNLGYSKTFSGFTIIDTDGKKYIFGGNTGLIEYSIDFANQDRDFWQADSWYLKEIVEPSGKKISFEYERGSFIAQLSQSLSQNFGTGGSGSGYWLPPCGLSSGSFREDYPGRLNAPVYLRRIVGATGTVTFNRSASAELKPGIDYNSMGPNTTFARDVYGIVLSNFVRDRNIFGMGDGAPYFYQKIFPVLAQEDSSDPTVTVPQAVASSLPYSRNWALWLTRRLSWSKLDAIEIRNNGGALIKSFTMDYESGEKRLTLNSVKEGGMDGSFNTPYTFSYNAIDNVPYFSGKLDHWGFYNGVLSDIGELGTNATRYFNSRASNFYYAKQGTLNKIVFPTGGYTQFEYESNRVGKQLDVSRTSLETLNAEVGGIRIKKMRTVDPVQPLNAIEKEFLYVKDYRNSKVLSVLPSSGILGGKSQYLFSDFRVKAIIGSAYYAKNQFSSMSHLPGSSNSLGNHIGYSQVVERRNDNSYTIHYFTNFDNGHMDEHYTTINLTASPYIGYTSLENERGKEYTTESFNPADQLVNKKHSEYLAVDKANQFARAIKASAFQICPGTNDWYVEGNAYKNYTYSYLPTSVTDTTFDISGADPASSMTMHSYDLHRQVKSELIVTSEQKTKSLINYYPYDLSSSPINNQMVQGNLIAPILKQDVFFDNSLTDTYMTEYDNTLSPNPALYLPKQIITQRAGSLPEVRVKYLKYDNRGNLLSLQKDGGVKINYIWGYGKNFPVAEITNADYAAIENAPFNKRS